MPRKFDIDNEVYIESVDGFVTALFDYLRRGGGMKDLDYSLNNAKQRLIYMFVNRVVLYDDECYIYFNIGDDKGTQLKLKEQPDFEQEKEFLTKKEQPEQKCSDCYHLADIFQYQLNAKNF